MTYNQQAGQVKVREGNRVAVSLGLDFDAICLWDGTFHLTSPSYQSRGEFGAEVGVPRLLALCDKLGIKATWCIPGHTVETFTPQCLDIVKAGHEVAHHGYAHENPTVVDRERERRVLERGLEALSTIGVRPKGYRSPAWDFSPNTLSLLEELEFEWDSSLMGNDLHPYRPRPWTTERTVQHGDHMVADGPSMAGPASPVVEVPVTWFLDDFPAQEVVLGGLEGLKSIDGLEQRWRSYFDYAVANETGAVYTLTLHPQTAGRPHMMPMIEGLLRHILDNGGEFMTVSEIVAATTFDN